MSREFREVSGGYFHDVLSSLEHEETGDHEVTQALTRLYLALAPLEYDCASTEACDSGDDRPYIGLVSAMPAIKQAVASLHEIEVKIAGIQRAAVEAHLADQKGAPND